MKYEARDQRGLGVERLSGKTGRNGSSDTGKKPAHQSSGKPSKARSSRGKGPLERALRTAYDDALQESVPDDFLDLLKKLG